MRTSPTYSFGWTSRGHWGIGEVLRLVEAAGARKDALLVQTLCYFQLSINLVHLNR